MWFIDVVCYCFDFDVFLFNFFPSTVLFRYNGGIRSKKMISNFDKSPLVLPFMVDGSFIMSLSDLDVFLILIGKDECFCL